MPTPSSISLTLISAPVISCNSPSTFCTKSAVGIFLSSTGTSCIVNDASLSAAASPPCSTSSPPTLTKLSSSTSSVLLYTTLPSSAICSVCLYLLISYCSHYI